MAIDNNLKDTAGNVTFKITAIFFATNFVLWLMGVYIEHAFSSLFSPMWSGILFKLSAMILIFIGSAFVFYIVYQNQVKYRTFKNYFEIVFTQTPLPILIINKQTLEIINANYAASKLFKFDVEDLLKLKLLELVTKSERANINNEIISFSRDEHTLLQVELNDSKRETIFTNLIFKALEPMDGMPIYMIGIVDISDLVMLRYRLDMLKIKSKQFDGIVNNMLANKFTSLHVNLDLIQHKLSRLSLAESNMQSVSDIEMLIKEMNNELEKINKEYMNLFTNYTAKFDE